MLAYKALKLKLSSILICTMALTKGVQNKELNSIFKSLAERVKEGETYKKFNDFFTGGCLPKSSSELNNSEFDIDHIMFRAYGSAAENLQCYDPCDAGDMDFMVFSNSYDLIVQEEMLEYSLENPLHVRIKGSDHPVLKSCLVKDTEYVATLALKNFHPSIFGSMSPLLLEFLSFFCQLSSVDESVFRFTAHLSNNIGSPAVTLNMSHFVGSISEYLEMLQVHLQNAHICKAAAETECIVHFLCEANGIDYTREHAEILDDFLLLYKDAAHLSSRLTYLVFSSAFFPQLKDRWNEIKARQRTINGRLRHANVHAIDKEVVNTDKSGDKESGGNTVNFLGATLAQNEKTHASVIPKKCFVDQMMSTDDSGSSSSQSTTPRDSSENFHMLSEKLMSKEVTENRGVDVAGNCEDTGGNGDFSEQENESQTKHESLEKTGELTSKYQQRSPDDQEANEITELERKCCRWFENMFGTLRENFSATSKNKTQVTSGADFIPAFSSRGWPKVAKEWIKRERKWPSPDIVTRVIQEGFHLVVKSPKNNGNPDRDFRISFSHAEYLLCQDMNDIQRECFRCLKRYHRCYLITQPKSLVSFHLKNIFLRTIEETGAEMWTENNRGECMMKLLGNLLEAVRKRDLPHFFVRSYNLFSVDYIENPDILESLARKVEEIMENPVRLAKQLLQNQEEANHIEEEKCVSKRIPGSESSLSGKSAAGEGHVGFEDIPSKNSCGTLCTKEKVPIPLLPTETPQEYCPVYRYHDLHDIYQDVTKQLVDMVVNSDRRSKAMYPLETSLMEDLTELVSEYGIPVSMFARMFNTYWHKRAYYWIWISNEPDMRHRILVAIQGLVELLKYSMKKDDCWQADNSEALEALINRKLDPFAEHSLELSHVLPPGKLIYYMDRVYKMFDKLIPSQMDSKTSLVESFREFVTTSLVLCGHSEEIPYFLDTLIGLMGNEPRDFLVGFQGLLEVTKEHASRKDDVQLGGSDKSPDDLHDRGLDLMTRFISSLISSSALPNAVYDTDDILLD